MLLAIVLLVFALHVAAWLVLPSRSAHAARAHAQPYRQMASALPMGEALEGRAS